jgi:hypothetical protein
MLDLYKYVTSKLNSIGIKPYTDYIPTEKAYPYVQFKFTNALPNGWSELNLLQIDVWDKSISIIQVENITDSIDKIFNRLNETTADFCIQVYRNNPHRLSIPDTDMEIRRRQLRYIIKIYRKE